MQVLIAILWHLITTPDTDQPKFMDEWKGHLIRAHETFEDLLKIKYRCLQNCSSLEIRLNHI
jgi:hypothetical protein